MSRKTGESHIDIRCKKSTTKTDFKRIAADFQNYEELIIWFNTNYGKFTKIVPPHPVRGGVL